jgi:diaminohydroxyphosphoribosylaminopyrimidine deaminase/5-amino-6-(5-phosphoribosylamino)uracil reductase
MFARDVRRVLLEGGPTLAAAFLRAGLVDEVVVHLAPKRLGAGAPLVDDLGITGIGDALTLQVTGLARLGGDVEIRLRPTRHTGVRRVVDSHDVTGGG